MMRKGKSKFGGTPPIYLYRKEYDDNGVGDLSQAVPLR